MGHKISDIMGHETKKVQCHWIFNLFIHGIKREMKAWVGYFWSRNNQWWYSKVVYGKSAEDGMVLITDNEYYLEKLENWFCTVCKIYETDEDEYEENYGDGFLSNWFWRSTDSKK